MDWIAEYLTHPERFPVLSRVTPGEVRRALPSGAARARRSRWTRSCATSSGSSCPASRTGTIPGFFAYFAITGSVPGILGEMLAAALNVNAMLWRTVAGRDRAGGASRSTGCAS